MERHSANALALAEFLESESGVEWVRYPFLASDPGHDLAKKQMKLGSGIVTADLGLDAGKTSHFLGALRYFPRAESLGGIESLVCHPASMTHASVPKEVRESVGITDSVVRFSVGIETIEDLIGDVSEALKKVRCATLVLNGEKDTQVDPKLNLPEIRKALAAGGNTKFEVHELPGLNHLFQNCTTGSPGEYRQIEETMSPTVLKMVAEWIKKQ